MAMFRETKAPGQNAISKQRQRSSTPTTGIIARSSDGCTGTTYKSSMQEPSEQQLDAYAASFSSSDRQDLIQRLKRSQSPTWQRSGSINPFYKPYTPKDNPTTQGLLPAINLASKDATVDVDNDSQDITEALFDMGASGIAHYGNPCDDDGFRPNKFPKAFHEDLDRIERTDNDQVADSSSTSWYKPLASPSKRVESASPSIDIPNSSRTPIRPRAPSLLSYSPRFVLRPPTSPLARQSSNDGMEFSPIDLSRSPTKSNRRHTLPPHSFQAARTSSQLMTMAQAARQPPSLQREHSLPYQTHRVRKSFTGLPFPSSPSPSTPSFLRSRRSSFASDASPIQASMVGSYEESILRGRMSTTPSKPLDFTAQIGALGRGDCKPKYPAHVSVDFPAVYYAWNISNGGSISDEPSPYVGQIDLEHKLNVPMPREKPRKRRDTQPEENELNESSVKLRKAKRNEKRRRRSVSPTSSLQSFGGCYRIPQQGQLQILIKNPNKTAVKLFLVPYDLEGMQPGTKTFVRQRSYSAGPILEKPLTSRSFSDSIIETKQTPLSAKPILRYLVQVNICCPAKGRFYLYKSVHVVFANRVPDDKEKLQTEILWPEPRYSPWKPSNTDSGASTPADKQSLEVEMSRRRSYGLPGGSEDIDEVDGIAAYSRTPSLSRHVQLHSMSQAILKPDSIQSPKLAFRNINSDIYTKLNPGESGYGGRPVTPESGESLLARRLKSMNNDSNDSQVLLGVEDMEME